VAQANDIIQRAFRLLGITASGETSEASESADALTALNDLLADMSAPPYSLLLYSSSQLSYAVPGPITSFTVGPAGNVVATRPTAVSDVFIRAGGIDYPVDPITPSDYYAIAMKTLIGPWPAVAWYDPTLPAGRLYLWPGATSGQTIYFVARQPLDVFASINDTADVPPNYLRMLAYNLAVEIAPEYGVEASPTVQRIASASKSALKRANAKVPKLRSEAGYLASDSSGRSSNLISIMSGG
jgi:hypothetical protein